MLEGISIGTLIKVKISELPLNFGPMYGPSCVYVCVHIACFWLYFEGQRVKVTNFRHIK